MIKVVSFGVNRVNRTAADYDGWEGALSGCCGDASALVIAGAQAGAEGRGYLADYFGTLTVYGSMQPDYRLVGDATRDRLRATFREISASAPGDLWILWYSGHTAQVSYAFETIESLCLFDGLLDDRELWNLFASVPAGVRVLFGADTCHSGGLPGTRQVGPFNRVKACPIRFRGVGRPEPAVNRSQLAGDICFWAGCQKEQFSLDGPHNGLFTATALAALQPGISYPAWGEAVRRLMPATQQPEMLFYGNPAVWQRAALT